MNMLQFQTRKGMEPFLQMPHEGWAASSLLCVEINPYKQMQTIIGFGGAFTESAAYVYSKLSPDKQKEFVSAYFHPERGIGYTLGRIAITSCDFSFGGYTYIENGDFDTFTIEREEQYLLPLMRAARVCLGKDMTLFAAPWSPPMWMKTNGQMKQGGSLKPEFYEAWAQYFVRTIIAYKEKGFEIFAVSTQNEPEARQTWESCIYTADQELEFVKNHLGPAIKNAGLDTKITIWDHNRDNIVHRAADILNDEEAASYIWGTAFHWYVSEEFKNVGRVHDMFPDKHLVFSEGCVEGGVQLDSWETGERYGRNMIGDFNNWNEAFLDWNLILDETGGPNHVGNLCDAPIISDIQNNRLIYNSSYYYIAHFSKFIQPGAVRIGCEGFEPLLSTAFLNPNGDIIAVLQNETDMDIHCALKLKAWQQQVSCHAHSISTVICKRE